MDRMNVSGRVDQHAALWLRGCNFAETLSDAGVEGRVQALVSVRVAATRSPSVIGDRFRNIEDQCQVRGHSQ